MSISFSNSSVQTEADSSDITWGRPPEFPFKDALFEAQLDFETYRLQPVFALLTYECANSMCGSLCAADVCLN